MRIFNWDAVTVAEVNKHLKPVVQQLIVKYNKSTHPDFEQDLRRITGIGWKQVKNYRNNPDPSRVLKQNSKVIQFVLKQRKNDQFYILKKVMTQLSLLALVVMILVVVITGVTKKYDSEQEKLNVLIENQLKQLLERRESACRKINAHQVQCEDGLYTKEM